MENNNIVLFLLVIIVVLAAVFGIMFFQSLNAKEPSKVKIISNKTQYEDGKLAIQLTDLNKTPISKEKVNITIINKKDKVVANNTIETNDDGKAKVDLDLKKGEFTVNVTYGGNKNYTGNNTTQKLTIKEEVKQTQSEEVSAVNSPDKYRTRSDTDVVFTRSGDVVELNRDGDIVSVNGDPNGGGHSYANH